MNKILKQKELNRFHPTTKVVSLPAHIRKCPPCCDKADGKCPPCCDKADCDCYDRVKGIKPPRDFDATIYFWNTTADEVRNE